MNVEGSGALVTGANRGIGNAIAEELLARGAAKVYAGVRDLSSITDPRLTPVGLDVTHHERFAQLSHELTDVTLVINNAGIGRPGTPLRATLEDARAELETNYLSLVASTQVVGVHVGFVDTEMAAGFDAEKIAPQQVASSALDAVEAGMPEALVDDFSRFVKSSLSDDQNAIYPGIESQFAAAAAS